MTLPSFLSEVEVWMRAKEDNAMNITTQLLQMESGRDLLINIFIIGVIPAIGEELIFRGLIQQSINYGKSNYHLGIWASAFLFSAIHLQFYGFIPRLLLGALFGYLFYWSASLWIPIFAHFVNNSMAVIVAYYFRENGVEREIEQVGTTSSTWPISILFAIVLLGLLFYFKKLNTHSRSIDSSFYST